MKRTMMIIPMLLLVTMKIQMIFLLLELNNRTTCAAV